MESGTCSCGATTWSPAVDESEDGAQHLVALDDGVERLLEHVQVERAAVPERDLDVVERVAGAELLQEPEALLGERERVRR